MKKNIIAVILIICMFSALSQENAEEKKFEPSGKTFGKIFSNFHAGISETNQNAAFEITRAYFGYKYNLSEHFSLKTNIDVGNPKNASSYEYTAYLKTAALSYSKENFAVDFGLIGLIQFKEQEKIWGHRYIYKSFQDLHKFGHSADLGIIVKYLLLENLQVDLTIRNGEGYKKIQSDNTFRSGIGATYHLGNFITRGYFDVIQTSVIQSTIAGFLAYQYKDKLISGVEYNLQKNANLVDGQDLTGFSIYSSYHINKKYEVFGRYDILSSNKLTDTTDNWNIAKDGQSQIIGLQYKLVKNAKVSVNYQNWIPKDNTQDSEPYIYLNLEYKF